MAMTQMNTRIDSQVKERGDAVLAQAGYSPSRAIRAVWSFAASHAHDPEAVKDFLQQAEGGADGSRTEAVEAKLQALDRGLRLHEQLERTIGARNKVEHDLPDDRHLRGEALFSRWEERGLL